MNQIIHVNQIKVYHYSGTLLERPTQQEAILSIQLIYDKHLYIDMHFCLSRGNRF